MSDWSLRRGDKPVAVRLVTERDGYELDVPRASRLLRAGAIDFDPKKEATWSRGKAVSPWDDLTIDSDYIKAEAQAGRMDEVLYAVAIRTADGREFRAPTDTDLDRTDGCPRHVGISAAPVGGRRHPSSGDCSRGEQDP